MFIGHIQNNFQSASLNITAITKTSQTIPTIAKHFHKNHDLNDTLIVTVLENNIKTAAAQRYHEDKRNYKLKTLAPHGLNQ